VNGDQEFRERFASLRREDAKRALGFERVLQRSPRRPASRLGALAAASCVLAAAMVVTVLQLSHRARPAPYDATLSLANWRAPTDFLLNTPGRELLRSVPRIGEPSELLRRFPGLDDPTPSRSIGQEPHS
jgi:hypothetical protein